MKQSTNRRTLKKEWLFASIVVLVHAIFYLLALKFTRIYMGDSMEYIYEATNIRRFLFFYSGNPAMPIVPELMTQRQPLYPLFLMVVYFFSVNNWIVLVIQNIFSVWNICYTRRLMLSFGYRDKYDGILLVLLVGYPAQFINANTIAPDILLQTVVLLYIGQAVLYVQQKRLRNAVLLSIWLSVGMMVKPVCYPLVLPHLLLVAGIAVRYKLRFQRPFLASVIPVIALLLYSYWNFTRTEKFHFSSNQAFNAVYYYYPYVRFREGQDSAVRFISGERKRLEAMPDFRDRYDAANEEGVRLLRQNWKGYLPFHLVCSARTLLDPGKAEIDLFTGKLTYGRLYRKDQAGFMDTIRKNGLPGLTNYVRDNPSLMVALLVMLLNAVRLAGLILFLKNRGTDWMIRVVVVGLIVYFLVAAGPIENTRYFLPVSLLAIGCAATGIGHFFTGKFENGRA